MQSPRVILGKSHHISGMQILSEEAVVLTSFSTVRSSEGHTKVNANLLAHLHGATHLCFLQSLQQPVGTTTVHPI